MTDNDGEVTMTPGEQEFDVVAAMQALLADKNAPEPEPEDDEPAPAQETEEDPEEVTPEPSAELEGAVVETKAEPEKPAVEQKAETPAPKTEAKPEEPNPQDQLLTQLNTLVPNLQFAIAQKFPEVKTQQDLWALGQKDPAQYNEYVILDSQLRQAQAAQTQLEQTRYQRFVQAEAAKLQKELPDYFDPEKGAKMRSEFVEFAKQRGFSEERIKNATAADVLTIRDAIEWRKHLAEQAKKPAEIAAQIAKAKDKAAKAPPVQKPGVPEKNGKVDRVAEKAQQFSKSGHLNDLTALLQESGIA